MDTLNKFSDFAIGEAALDGDKSRIDDLINKEIVITSYRVQDSKFSKNKSGKYITVQFKYAIDGSPYIFFTGSDVIIDQLGKYKEQLPFVTTIKKINRYYTLS